MTGRSLANAYAQALGSIFTTEPKPYEVELIVAEVGQTADDDQIYRLTYDGSVQDERGFAVMGGAAERISGTSRPRTSPALPLAAALRVAVQALAVDDTGAAQLQTEQLEVAVLDRTRQRARKFGRVSPARIADLLSSTAPPTPSEPAARSTNRASTRSRRRRRRPGPPPTMSARRRLAPTHLTHRPTPD